jgi:2-keto-3-deoxy-L-rhamnonate aldolase RhmA
MNLLKQRMISGESVFGTWCMLPSSFTVDVIAKTGLDYIVIDMEHGTITLETAGLQTCKHAGQMKRGFKTANPPTTGFGCGR